MKYVEKKMINCGNCLKCSSGAYPHGPYAYEVTGSRTKDRDNRKWRYLGKAGDSGSAGKVEPNTDGCLTIDGKLDVVPKTDDYERMGYEQRILENKKKFLGMMPAAFPPEHSVLGYFAQACAESEDEHAYTSGKVANHPAMRYIAEATRSEFADEAERMLEEHGARRIDDLPLDKERYLDSLARRLYSEARRSIIEMQQNAEKQYEHLKGVLRDAGIGDAPEQIMRGKSELRKLQRYQNADIKKETAGKKKSEAAAITERIREEYQSRKEKVRKRIKKQHAAILEVLQAEREREADVA